MVKKFRNHLLFKGFMSLPLWGKVAIPVAAIILISFLGKILSTAFYVGIVLVIAYLVMSAVLYFQDRKKS